MGIEEETIGNVKQKTKNRRNFIQNYQDKCRTKSQELNENLTNMKMRRSSKRLQILRDEKDIDKNQKTPVITTNSSYRLRPNTVQNTLEKDNKGGAKQHKVGGTIHLSAAPPLKRNTPKKINNNEVVKSTTSNNNEKENTKKNNEKRKKNSKRDAYYPPANYNMRSISAVRRTPSPYGRLGSRPAFTVTEIPNCAKSPFDENIPYNSRISNCSLSPLRQVGTPIRTAISVPTQNGLVNGRHSVANSLTEKVNILSPINIPACRRQCYQLISKISKSATSIPSPIRRQLQKPLQERIRNRLNFNSNSVIQQKDVGNKQLLLDKSMIDPDSDEDSDEDESSPKCIKNYNDELNVNSKVLSPTITTTPIACKRRKINRRKS